LLFIQNLIDLLFMPFARVNPGYALAFAALLVTVLALVVYKFSSSQAGIKAAKEKIKAHFVEVWLYIDDPVLILKAQAGIFLNGGKYLAYALVPLAIMIIPVTVFLINCEYRFNYRQFREGEDFLVKVRVDPAAKDWEKAAALDLPETIQMDAPPLRIEARDAGGNEFKEIDYRLKILKGGDHMIAVGPGPDRTRVFILADQLTRFRPVTHYGKTFGEKFWTPGYQRSPLVKDLKSIDVSYQKADFDFLGWNTWWVWPFLILTFVFAFALKPVIKVEF
jgi:hypothetical protein